VSTSPRATRTHHDEVVSSDAGVAPRPSGHETEDAPDHGPSNLTLRIGLTGGIGSGKTRVSDRLSQLGASVIDTDVIAHTLTRAGGGAIAPLREAFGDDVIVAGALDRAAMRARVFADPQARRLLEGILHPLIAQQAREQAARAQGPYLVFVVPLLVESGRWRERVDRICVVDCDAATQIARVQARSGLSETDVRAILAVQATREQRLAVAQDVIDNGAHSTEAGLRAQVDALHMRWLACVP
jgi:dephospho-CoA kinase